MWTDNNSWKDQSHLLVIHFVIKSFQLIQISNKEWWKKSENEGIFLIENKGKDSCNKKRQKKQKYGVSWLFIALYTQWPEAACKKNINQQAV